MPVARAAPSAQASTRSAAARKLGVVERAHPDARGGALGDDVRRLAAIADDAVDADAAWQLLAQQSERHEERDHAVERVDAALRIRRRVGRAAAIPEAELPVAEEQPVRAPHAGGVRHQRDVDVGEGARLDEAALADAGLLGRAADNLHAHEVLGQHGRQRGCSEQRRGTRKAVAAGVPDLGKRVHLREQRDPQRRGLAAARRDEGGLHAGGRRFDAEAARVEPAPVARTRLVLGQRQFRIRGHPAREVAGLAEARLDRGEQLLAFLLGGVVRVRHPVPDRPDGGAA